MRTVVHKAGGTYEKPNTNPLKTQTPSHLKQLIVQSKTTPPLFTPKTSPPPFTTDLAAVLLANFTTGHSLGAAVAAIVRTPFVVVLVVAVAVSLVLRESTFRTCRLALVVWIDARTLQKTEL